MVKLLGEEKPLGLTDHARERIRSRFNISEGIEILEAVREAVEKGCKKEEDGDIYVQHGSMFLVISEKRKIFSVVTVHNLTRGASRSIREKLPSMESIARGPDNV